MKENPLLKLEALGHGRTRRRSSSRLGIGSEFLAARFSGRGRYRRRLAKVAALENQRTEALPDISLNLEIN